MGRNERTLVWQPVVIDVDSRCARLGKALHPINRRVGLAEALLEVDDDRQSGDAADLTAYLDQTVRTDDSNIRKSAAKGELQRLDADGVESRGIGDLRRHHVVGTHRPHRDARLEHFEQRTATVEVDRSRHVRSP